jgi:hypothetical protein
LSLPERPAQAVCSVQAAQRSRNTLVVRLLMVQSQVQNSDRTENRSRSRAGSATCDSRGLAFLNVKNGQGATVAFLGGPLTEYRAPSQVARDLRASLHVGRNSGAGPEIRVRLRGFGLNRDAAQEMSARRDESLSCF